MARKKQQDKPNVTSLRTEQNVRRYKINGRIYTFVVTKLDDGIPYGYCYAHKIWAWLFDDYVHDTNGNVAKAELL